MTSEGREPRGSSAGANRDATRPGAAIDIEATLPGGAPPRWPPNATSGTDATLSGAAPRPQVAGDLGETRPGDAPPPLRLSREIAETLPAAVRARRDETHAAGAETLLRGAGSFVAETRLRGDASFVDDPVAASVPVGARIGRFVVLRELGRGAMGVVFAAYDEELDRKVAIKLLHAGGGDDASHGRSMLLREAQAMARLAHPNVVAVHEVGVLDGAVFVAMEYVAGVDLQGWLAAALRPWREVLAVLRQAGEGLVAAHREGLVHRDFKPSNVLVGEDGRVRVADFGLAARRSDSAAPGRAQPGAALTATLTGEGALIGTPLYMAPELLRGAPATALSDQYAYCVALYEALYGVRPFQADDLARLTAVVERQALPASSPRADVPEWLYGAVRRGLAKTPGDRWPSLAELVALLARDPEAERQQRRRRALQIAGAIAATAAIVTLLVFAIGAARRYAAETQAEARLAGLREQIGALQARGAADEAARLLQTFVTLPENRGTAVIARAHLEWAATQTDPDAAVDAYASAYIAARTPADGNAALRGLIDRLSARGRIEEAAAALAVLARAAPDEAAGPELQGVRLAAALAQRDLQAARAALASDDPGGWSPVFEDLSHVTDIATDRFAGVDLGRAPPQEAKLAAVDLDGDGVREIAAWTGQTGLQVLHRDPTLTPLRTIEIGPAHAVQVVAPLVAGEPLILASTTVAGARSPEVRLLTADADGTTRLLDRWPGSWLFHPATVDFDGDGQRELYVGTEAYTRNLLRLERRPDGTWTRRPAHKPTDAVHSDVVAVFAADFEGDGRSELVAALGPWRAYDVRVFKPTTRGELDLVARRAFGAYATVTRMRVGGRDVVAFVKIDEQIADERFSPDKPLGDPAGVYIVGLGETGIEVLGHLPHAPPPGGKGRLRTLFAGDLDGDGDDELIVESYETGIAMLRWRPGQPLRPHILAGLRPLLVDDLDGDGDAEIVAASYDEPGRVLVLGTGDAALTPRPFVIAEPRAVPPGIADPAIAAAWANAEQLVAIGLPRRTAAELAAIARLAGHVAPDMLLRTAELYAAVDEDAEAAAYFVAAATRPDITPAALAGAAQARVRLGEFAAAEALTRRRLLVVPEDQRAAVTAELAALAEVNTPRSELILGFTRPLDPRWRVHDPVAVRRALVRGELSVWAGPTHVVAEYPLVWDGGPAALEVELETDVVEWGTVLNVEVMGADGQPWLFTRVGGYGQSHAPRTEVLVSDDGHGELRMPKAPTVRGRLAVYPAFDTLVRETTVDGETTRRVRPLSRARTTRPPPGPLRLCITTHVFEPGYVGHVYIKQIRLTGFTAGEPGRPADAAAHQLVEGEYTAALATLAATPADSERAVWRIDALLELGHTAAATGAIAALLAAVPATSPVYAALHQRLRRTDPVALLAARPAFGPRMVDLLLLPGGQMSLRTADLEKVLVSLPATSPADDPSDPEAVQRLVLTDYLRGAAHQRAGQHVQARDAYAAAFARLRPDRPLPSDEELRAELLAAQISLAVAMGDRDAALQWVRMRLADTEIPYLVLERMQADAALTRLLGEATWAALLAELRATKP